MTMKTRNGKSINQMLSKANARTNWLKKLKGNVAPVINRLGDLFQLPRNVYNVPKNNTLTLEYIGQTDAESVVKARQRIEKVMDATIEGNTITAKCKRITMTFTLNGLPTVEVKQAA